MKNPYENQFLSGTPCSGRGFGRSDGYAGRPQKGKRSPWTISLSGTAHCIREGKAVNVCIHECNLNCVIEALTSRASIRGVHFSPSSPKQTKLCSELRASTHCRAISILHHRLLRPLPSKTSVYTSPRPACVWSQPHAIVTAIIARFAATCCTATRATEALNHVHSHPHRAETTLRRTRPPTSPRHRRNTPTTST